MATFDSHLDLVSVSPFWDHTDSFSTNTDNLIGIEEVHIM